MACLVWSRSGVGIESAWLVICRFVFSNALVTEAKGDGLKHTAADL